MTMDFLNGKYIVIYGAGQNGNWTYLQLNQKKYTPVCFIDDHAIGKLNEINIVNEREFFEMGLALENTVIIVSFYVMDSEKYAMIINRFVDHGLHRDHIVHFIELFMESYFDRQLLFDHADELKKSYSSLADEKSQKLLENYANAVCNSNAKMFSQPSNELQYFDKSIPGLLRGGGYFVDCGAYTGDTFEILRRENIDYKYMGIEPDIHNFRKLTKTIDTCDNGHIAILLPCATSNKNGVVRFSGINTPGSKISDDGNKTVPCITLDDVCSGLAVTYIKMDVEGAEYETLIGAEKIIKKHTPNLAVCTYHRTDDMWRLQNLIASYNRKYRFYLRSYYLFGRETVLYAIAD